MQSNSDPPVIYKKQTFGETFCGADRETYRWAQTISDLDIVVPVSPDITSADFIDVKATPETLQIRIKSPNDASWNNLVCGDFNFKIKSSETMWNLDKGKHINVHIEKLKDRWWDSLLKEEPKINLEAFELSRPISDVTEEEEMTLQKIWRKQLEKRNGPERNPHL